MADKTEPYSMLMKTSDSKGNASKFIRRISMRKEYLNLTGPVLTLICQFTLIIIL
jgi:hypothetical protein